MKFLWIQFLLADVWTLPQGWKRFGWQWHYIRCFGKTLLIMHCWGTIEFYNSCMNPKE